jgi:hypothetical protein
VPQQIDLLPWRRGYPLERNSFFPGMLPTDQLSGPAGPTKAASSDGEGRYGCTLGRGTGNLGDEKTGRTYLGNHTKGIGLGVYREIPRGISIYLQGLFTDGRIDGVYPRSPRRGTTTATTSV